MYKNIVYGIAVLCGMAAVPFWVSFCLRIISSKSDLWFIGIPFLVGPFVITFCYLLNLLKKENFKYEDVD